MVVCGGEAALGRGGLEEAAWEFLATAAWCSGENACLGMWRPGCISLTCPVTLDESLDLSEASVSSSLKRRRGVDWKISKAPFSPLHPHFGGEGEAGIWGLDLSQHSANPRDSLEAMERPGQLLQGGAGP